MDDFVQDTGMLRKMGCTCWQQGDGKRGRRAAQPAHGILDLTTNVEPSPFFLLSPEPILKATDATRRFTLRSSNGGRQHAANRLASHKRWRYMQSALAASKAVWAESFALALSPCLKGATTKD